MQEQNRLKNAVSPYLLQHADNPVNWYPWCEEAFMRAKQEDKPVFLSIGYSACHWCHVMARESFMDLEVAAALNRDFISIKVDREERPDVDHVYMEAIQAMTGSGGWPASLFLTPEKKPFFAGTYFPKTAGRGMMGFLELLSAITGAWRNERPSLEETGLAVMGLMAAANAPKAPDHSGGETLLNRAAESLERRFDKTHGGFGSAPKFPMAHTLLFLMAYAKAAGEGSALAMAEKTLTEMYRGGIYDHIGGGFCRYATDRAFLIPHFEKMLYDNALLLMAYSAAFRATGKKAYEDAALGTADYVLREMRDPDGGFYAAQDADSDGEEGGYYTLTPHEIEGVLGKDQAEAFCARYGITPEGNFEGKSIPNLLGGSSDGPTFSDEKAKLYAFRRSRRHVTLDDKRLTAWNGLMIAALSLAYRVFGEQRYLAAAKDAVEYGKRALYDGEGLVVGERGGTPMGPGFLEDYAFYALGLLALYEATLEDRYARQAATLCKKAVADFADEAEGGFFLSGKGNERLIAAPKPVYDGAIPSGNGAMALLLGRLSALTGDAGLEAAAKRQMAFLSAQAQGGPANHCFFLLALLEQKYPGDSIIVVWEKAADIDTRRFPLSALVRRLNCPEGPYRLLNGKPTYYVCQGQTCLPPTNEPPQWKSEGLN